MKIYLDFDGTVVEHQYPKIGKSNYGCLEVIKKLQDAGHDIILNSYRADCQNGTLEKAQKLLNAKYGKLLKNKRLIEQFRIQPILKFTTMKINPKNWDWNYFLENDLIFIDDICEGIPLKRAVWSNGWMVDWEQVDLQFQEKGIYEVRPKFTSA